jgi:hypothetical protein
MRAQEDRVPLDIAAKINNAPAPKGVRARRESASTLRCCRNCSRPSGAAILLPHCRSESAKCGRRWPRVVSNAGIAHRLWVTQGTVEKNVRCIMGKLDLPEAGDDHRRVLAVIAFLDAH